jgi:hypothetical protein
MAKSMLTWAQIKRQLLKSCLPWHWDRDYGKMYAYLGTEIETMAKKYAYLGTGIETIVKNHAYLGTGIEPMANGMVALAQG